MNYKEQIYKQLSENNGIVTSSWCVKEGIPSVYLTRMTKSGDLNRAARGIYTTSDDIYDSYFLLQAANPVCIFSYVSALDILGETDLIPGYMEVTVYSGYNASHLPEDVILHYLRKDLYELGIVARYTKYGNQVRQYDFEKTICDLVANRYRVDPDLFSKSMFRYVQNNDRDMHKLMNYGKLMGIDHKLRDIFEVLLNG